jgi:hypothetical protein
MATVSDERIFRGDQNAHSYANINWIRFCGFMFIERMSLLNLHISAGRHPESKM